MRAILIAVCGTAIFAAACFIGWMQFTGRVDVLRALRPEKRTTLAGEPQTMPASAPGGVDMVEAPGDRPGGEPGSLATRKPATPDDRWERDPWERARRPWEPTPPAVLLAEVDVVNATGGPISFEIDERSMPTAP